MKVLYNRVLVKIAEKVNKTEGGILLAPNTLLDRTTEATVVEAGNGNITQNGTLIPLTVKKGDTVLIPKGIGVEISLKGEKLHVLLESEIIAIL